MQTPCTPAPHASLEGAGDCEDDRDPLWGNEPKGGNGTHARAVGDTMSPARAPWEGKLIIGAMGTWNSPEESAAASPGEDAGTGIDGEWCAT